MYLHVLIPHDAPQEEFIDLLGAASLLAGDDDHTYSCWILDEDLARRQRTLSAVSNVASGPSRSEGWLGAQPDDSPIWPLFAFTVRAPLFAAPSIPVDTSDLIACGEGLWFHFVRAGSLDVLSLDEAEAAAAGLWGTEEGYTYDDGHCVGWFVTQGRGFDHVPAELHSVF